MLTATCTILPVAELEPGDGVVLVAQPNQEVYGGGGSEIELSGETMATAEGFVRRLTRRLTESPEVRDAEELSDEAASTGAQRACDCERGQEVTMVGTLRTVETNAKGCAGGVRAELFDGTDTVMLVWLGQRRIPGIDCGRTLKVSGRVGMLDNGGKAIYNPRYEIQR
jgi:hypothetical protein